MNKYSIRIERCEECEDHPLALVGYVNEEHFYGMDIRPEEFDELEDKVEEILDIVKDMYESELAQNHTDADDPPNSKDGTYGIEAEFDH